MALSEKDLQDLWPFKKKSIVLGMIFACILGVSNCTTQKVYNLNTMPTYNTEITNKNYAKLRDVQRKYFQIIVVRSQMAQDGMDVSREDRPTYIKAVDIYLYWEAVAMIQLFNGDYELSNKSAQKADEGLEQLKAILKKLIDHYSST